MWCGINHSQDKKCTICGTPRKTKSLQGGVIVSEKSFIELELAKMKAERALLSRRIENMEESVVPPQGEPLIQGYTAEQWQEIIDGGYLCEGASCGDEWEYMLLDYIPRDNGAPYYRPAQIKGVMRPIFVEPVGEAGEFLFFDDCSRHVGSSNRLLAKNMTWDEIMKDCPVGLLTKYIEL